MIRLNINTRSRYVQFWARGRKEQAVLLDTELSAFQTASFRSATSAVFIELSVNGTARGFVLSDFPSVNEDDEGLDMNDIVCFYRIWDASWKMVEHVSMTWTMMRDPKICLEWEGVGTACSSHSIVQTHKWLSRKQMDVYPKTLLAPSYLLSGELAFYYEPEDEYASEEWWKECLVSAMRILSIKKVSTAEDLQLVISFMFLSNYPSIHDNTLHTIDTILHNPSSKADHVCRAYHLLMSLLFCKHSDSDLASFKRKLATLGGFPYVAWTSKQEFVLLLVPYGKMHSALGIEVEPSVVVEGAELAAFRNASIIPVQPFCMDPPALSFLKARKTVQAFSPPAPLGNILHVFGNSHAILCPGSSDALAFQVKIAPEQEFAAHPPGTTDKELELLSLHKGVINKLTTHSKPDTVSDEMVYYTQKDSMVVKALYKVDPYRGSLDSLEQELDKADYVMDAVYSSSANSWLVRVGCGREQSSFLF